MIGSVVQQTECQLNNVHVRGLGNLWRPLATLGDMLENDHFGGNFPIEIPIKNENLSPNAILLSITLKIFLWPPLTQRHGWLRERSSIQKNVYCGTP